MIPGKDPIDLIIYVILFGSSIFVNKYVLSVLSFTYPTIFQGWQTLIGGILLKIILSKNCLSVVKTDLDKPGFISLVPSFLFFAAGIVASSKALAYLSVPIYLCLHNTLNAILYIVEVSPSFVGSGGPIPLAASLLSIVSAVAAVLFEIDMTFSDSPYFWMLVFIACGAVQVLHSKIADARYSDVDRLYLSYIFSVVILAPASLYLEEAFEVLKFPNASRYDFYAGCLLSGILGLFLNLSIMKVKHHKYFSYTDTFSRIVVSLFSVTIFIDETSTLVKLLILFNLLVSAFVPVPTYGSEDTNADRSNSTNVTDANDSLMEPLLDEV